MRMKCQMFDICDINHNIIFGLVSLLFVLVFYFATPGVQASTGIYHAINFQGKIVNKADGTNISDGTYSFTFKFYDAASSGNQLPVGSPWSETQSLPVTSGVFKATLGSVTAIPSTLDFNSDSLYLDITFNGETFTTRVQMTAVPYAFNAERVNGLSVTNTTGTLTVPNGTTITFSGANNLTLTTTGATTATLPAGTITLADISSIQTLTNKTIGSTGLTFSGATTGITTVSNQNFTIVPNGTGKVGIGTTSPGAFLDVNGNVNIATYATAGASLAVGYASVPGGVGNAVFSGNVGIGTTSPAANLAVAGNVIEFGQGDAGTPTSTTIRGAAAGGSNIAGANIIFDASNGTGTGGSGALLFRTASPLGAASITYDAASHAQGSNTSSLSWTHTVGNNGNRLLMVGVDIFSSGVSVSSVTYGGVNLTHLQGVTTDNGYDTSDLWYLKNPVSGSATIAVTLSGLTGKIVSGAVSYSGVDQTSTTFGTPTSDYGGYVTSLSTTVTSNTGELVVDNIIVENITSGLNYGASQTERWTDNTGASGIIGAGSEQAGASSVTMQWSWTGGERAALIAVPIRPSGGSTADTLTERLRIDQNGNVGIGTTTPAEALSVVGNATMSGNLTFSNGGGHTIATRNFQNLTIGDTQTGSILFSPATGKNVQVNYSSAPTLDMMSISNAGQGTSTTGVDGLTVNFSNAGSSAIDNAALHLVATATNNTVGTTLEGLKIDNITGQANAVQTALMTGTGWGVGLNIGSGRILAPQAERTADALTSSQTVTIAGQAFDFAYHVTNNIGTTAGATVAISYNFTGLSTTDGTIYYFATTCQKGASSTASTSTVNIQIGGTTYGSCTTGSSTAARTYYKTFMIMRINGAWYPIAGLNSATSDQADLAENMPYTGIEPAAGALVKVSGTDNTVSRSDGAYDNKVIGVVSTNPNMTMGGSYDRMVPVALSGRVPVMVSSVNGVIANGDAIISSSLPGTAMKQSVSGISAGIAMETFDPFTRICQPAGSIDSIQWPDDNGTNQNKPCFKIPVSSLDTNVQNKLYQLYKLDPSDYIYVGKIMLFIGRTFTDPQNALQNLISQSLPGLNIDSDGLSGTNGNTAQNNQVQSNQSSTDSAKTIIKTIVNNSTDSSNLSLQLDSLQSRVNFLENTVFSNATASGSFLGALSSNYISTASGLTIMGKTNVFDLNILRSMTNGLLTIGSDATSSASIQSTVVPLQLQKDSLGNLEIMGTKIVIDTQGEMVSTASITAKEINTNKLNILEDKIATGSGILGASAGTAIIPTGQTIAHIKTSLLTPNSIVFATPQNLPTPVAALKIDETTVELRINSSLTEDLKINWWIVD